jgi:hypothetical protein
MASKNYTVEQASDGCRHGAPVGSPDRGVALCGDGGLSMLMGELLTAAGIHGVRVEAWQPARARSNLRDVGQAL